MDISSTVNNDDGFGLLVRYISRETGIDCVNYRELYLRRRIQYRMDRNKVGTYSEYYALLRKNPEEYSALIDCIGVNVTEFFRDVDVFGAIAGDILPGIIERKREDKSIRIWSACCATGQEPYSIAMILNELLGKSMNGYQVRIIATDIDEHALEIARLALYRTYDVSEVNKRLLNEYFLPARGPANKRNSEGQYVLRDEVKHMVSFERHDVMSGRVYCSMDMILCRNMLIYVTPELRGSIFAAFHKSLVTGGYLILGKTETLGTEFDDRFETVDLRKRIFRKRV